MGLMVKNDSLRVWRIKEGKKGMLKEERGEKKRDRAKMQCVKKIKRKRTKKDKEEQNKKR